MFQHFNQFFSESNYDILDFKIDAYFLHDGKDSRYLLYFKSDLDAKFLGPFQNDGLKI